MDTRVLKYFLTVAQLGNITKAANVLNITQPTLSRQLIALEEQLGGKLFIRGKREIRLTENGIIFQQRANEILSLVNKTEKEISDESEVVLGTVSIGCVESSVAKYLPIIMREFSARFPLVKFSFFDANGDDIKDKLDWGYIDLGIVLEPVETAKYDYEPIPLFETWGVIVPNNDPLASRTTIHPKELSSEPLLMPRRSLIINEIIKWFSILPEQLNVRQTHNLISNTLPLVEAGYGKLVTISGIKNQIESMNLNFIPFEPLKSSGHVLIWRKNKVFSKATQLLINFLVDNMEIFSKDTSV